MDQKHSFILDMYMLKPIKKIGKLWYNYVSLFIVWNLAAPILPIVSKNWKIFLVR